MAGMSDLSWVEHTEVIEEGDPAKLAFENNPGWHLLHITGGLHNPIQFVFGWGEKPKEQ